MKKAVFFIGGLLFIMSVLTSCSQFSKDGKVTEVITEKLQNNEKEMKDIDSKVNDAKTNLKKLDDLSKDVDKLAFNDNLIDFTPFQRQINSTTFYQKSNLYYKINTEFYKPFADVIQKNGITLSYPKYANPYAQGQPEVSNKDKSLDVLASEFFFTSISEPIVDYNDPYNNNALKFTADDLADLKKKYDKGEFENKKSKLSGFIKITSGAMQNFLDAESQIKKDKTEYNQTLSEEFSALKKQSIDRMLIVIALPTFGIIILLLMCIPRLYSNPNTLVSIFEKGLLIQLITVFLLTVTILILGIGGKLSTEVLGTLLGGISVYVLQKTIKD